jgi:3-oxoacyl-[acyl-carrier protein] reductase
MKGKVSLITGASRGIGRAVALLLASAGSDVIIHYTKSQDSAREVKRQAEKLGVRAVALAAEIGDRRQVDAMIDQALKELGRIDILVNNAGIWERNPINGMSEDDLKRTVDINLMGSYYTIMRVVPHMVRQNSGSIINISSTAGQRGEAFYSPYAATKGAIISLTKSLAAELAPNNIRVNCVAPGWVATDMSRDALEGDGAKQVFAQIPLGRVGTPEELAGPVLFLASDMASFITGEILNVNGGAVLCG